MAELATRGNLRVYRELVRARIRSYASYRGSFVIDVCTNGLIPLMDLAVVIAIFRVPWSRRSPASAACATSPSPSRRSRT